MPNERVKPNFGQTRLPSASICLFKWRLAALTICLSGSFLSAAHQEWVASAEHPEGEKMHITAYGAIIHAEDVAVHPHIRSGNSL